MTQLALPPPIRLEFVYTYDDIRAANRLMTRQPITRSILASICILIVGAMIYGAFKNPEHLSGLLLYPASTLLAIGFVSFFQTRFARVKWQKNNLANDQFVTLSESGVEWKNSDSHLQNKWTAYRRFIEGTAVFVLYINDTVAVPLPKHIMTPEQIAAVRLLLQTHLTPAQGFPVQPPSPPPTTS